MHFLETLDISKDSKRDMRDFLKYVSLHSVHERRRLERRGFLPAGEISLPIPRVVLAPLDWMRIMRLIEIMIARGDTYALLVPLFDSTETGGVWRFTDRQGKEMPAEFFEIWLRTCIARDKQMFYKMGLFEPAKDRKEISFKRGRFVANRLLQMYAFARIKEFRQHPGLRLDLQYAAWDAAGDLNSTVLKRLGEALDGPGENFNALMEGDLLESYLLEWWAAGGLDKKGKEYPPLCYLADDAIAALANHALGMNALAGNYVRKTWERLGLQRLKKPPVKEVDVGPDKIILRDHRVRNQLR